MSSDNNIEGSNNWVGRIDYNLNTRNRIFYRAIIGSGNADAYAGAVYGEYFQAVPSRQENHAIVWTGTLTNRLVNQTLFGYNFFLQNFDDANHSLVPQSWGLDTGAVVTGTPATSITGFNQGGVGITADLGRTDTTWHITDDLVYTKGGHTFKFGGEFRHQKIFVHYRPGLRGSFSFDGSAGPWYVPGTDTAPANYGNMSQTEAAFADFLGGYLKGGYGGFATGDPARNLYMLTGSGYFADSWQIKPTLNISYGLRYDYNTPWYDPTHTISTWSPAFSTSTTPPSLQFPGAPGSTISSLYPSDGHMFGPRIGFAWTPKRGGKTVIRGGWGVYYDVLQAHLFASSSAGDSSNSGVNRNPGGRTQCLTSPTPLLKLYRPTSPFSAMLLGPLPRGRFPQ